MLRFFERSRSVVAALVIGVGPIYGSIHAAEPVSFSRQVQPVLARRCFPCHGPDKSEAGLRLHQADSALARLDSGNRAVVPGAADQSELLRRVLTADPDERMPPEGKPLLPGEIAILKSWIESGAKWQSHWAFEPLSSPEPPAVQHQEAVRNPIDAFVLARLEERGLALSPAVEPRALLRRLFHDLTGLPPTPEDLEQFETAYRANPESAYGQMIDQLLESPHYGERWARHWLDVVRYADTNSFERDGPKPYSWQYRDYVVRSFNDDKPYDEFVREQLAGDEFENPTADNIIATGFYRLGLWDDEPVDRELAMYDGFDDILTTVGQGLFGLTLNCARCHDHKIDPIPQREYYGLLAFFRNITPNGNENPQVVRPIFHQPGEQQQFEQAKAELQQKRNELQSRITAIEEEFRQKWQGLADELSYQDLDDLEYRFYRDTWQRLPDFEQLKAETSARAEYPYFDIRVATRPEYFGLVFTAVLKVPADGSYSFTLDSDDGSRLLLDGKVLLEHDGIHGQGDAKTAKVELKQGRVPIRLEYFQAQAGQGLSVSWTGPGFPIRWLSAVTADGLDLAKLAGNGANNDKPANLRDLLRSRGAELLGQERIDKLQAWQRELEKLKRERPWNQFALCVTEHGKEAPETFILGRGNPQSRGDKVEPTFLSAIGGGHYEPLSVPSRENSTGRRLVFANWATRPDHRLTSRVITNRIWQQHFGRGIVRSPNNFGQLGDAPTHPELLDWLAQELVRNGWRLKPLHILILLSNTYRQTSVGHDEGMAKDPGNDLFWRFNMRRLGAEELRDSVLAAGGRLNSKMYGPGVYIDLSAEVLAGQSQPGNGWGNSPPEEQARRSIYVQVKRSLIPPLFASFDFPDTDTTCEARFITTQPAQALAMLNGEWINQQSQAFANRIMQESPADETTQIQLATRWILGRKATALEVDEARRLLQVLREKGGQSAERALSSCCLLMLNLNEFLYVD